MRCFICLDFHYFWTIGQFSVLKKVICIKTFICSLEITLTGKKEYRTVYKPLSQKQILKGNVQALLYEVAYISSFFKISSLWELKTIQLNHIILINHISIITHPSLSMSDIYYGQMCISLQLNFPFGLKSLCVSCHKVNSFPGVISPKYSESLQGWQTL